MLSRRSLLGIVTPAAAGALAWRWAPAATSGAGPQLKELAETPGEPQTIARDERFWGAVQQAFAVDRSIANLNNGGVSSSPKTAQAALARHQAFANQAPAHNLWGVLEPQRDGVRSSLASTFGVDAEEVAITRNASEALEICQLGFDLERGDEVVTTTLDYPRMLDTFAQRERRDGIVVRTVGLPIPTDDPAEVVRRLEGAITERTRLMLVCHMLNVTGQLLPVREIVAMARRRGVPVIVDGAHAFAHVPFQQADLDCDYYATSLHKWLCGPLGTGMLYVRRRQIAQLWPLMGAPAAQDGDIRKLEQLGTHPCPNTLAIAEALDLHHAIGIERKAARLVYLRDRWTQRFRDHARARLLTSLEPGQAGGMATVAVEGEPPLSLTNRLFDRHRILVAGIVRPELRGIRVSPSIYTTLEEVDRFADVLDGMLKA